MAKYSEEVFRLADKELKRRRESAENENLRRRAEVFAEHPELAGLNAQLEGISKEFLVIVLGGGSEMKAKLSALKEKSIDLSNKMGDLLEAFTGDRDYLKTKYSCPECDDTGFRDGIRCACHEKLLKQYAAEELAENCGVKLNDFVFFSLDYYPQSSENGISPREKMQKLFGYCIKYASNFSRNSPSLLFIGKTGLGKTYLSSCIANEVIQKGFSVAFGQFSTFLRKIEDEHFGRAEGNTLDSLIKCDLLILDDLGSEFRTQFTEAVLYELLNARINSKLPTIISTNMSMNELNNTYNERLISRITGCYVPFMFFGKDIRPMIRNI